MKLRKLTAFLLCIFVMLSSVVVFAEETPAEEKPILENGEIAKLLTEQSANLIISRYKDPVTREELYEKTLMAIMESHPELIEEVYKAMFNDLDEHTTYYTTEEYNYFTDSMSGEFSGIGVVVSEIPQGLLVSSTTAESPAAQAGIRQGDIIISADGVDLAGMPLEKARTFIIGEIGTTVKIGVKRGEEILEFTVTRQPVIVEPGSYQIIDGTVGYIELQSFDHSSPILVDKALDEFDKQGITNIIFDVRYNLGGSVDAFSQICQRMIPKGPIIHFQYQDEKDLTTLYSQCKNPKYSVIVLANEYSASASEAFCGVVQDSGIGFVVGDVTYGKGTMQTLTNFRIGGGVKMTVAEYLTRNKRHIDKVGIQPDYTVYDSIVKMKNSDLVDFDFDTVMKLGDKGPTVLALNQRLWAMGYGVGIPSDEFTQETHSAVVHFQVTKGMEANGICDTKTQIEIQNVMQLQEFSDNKIFKTALEIFKSGNFKKYLTNKNKKK